MNRRKGNKRKTTPTRTAAAISIHTSLQAISEDKTLIQVAVALNAKESEVTRFYKEYLKLNQLHDLSIVYQELKGDIIPFLKLYRSAKAAGMSVEHVVNLLRIANSIDNDNNNLPAVEHRYQKLTRGKFTRN